MFIKNALKVKNNLWRYGLGVLIIFIFTQLGSIPLIVAIFQKVGLEGAAKLNPSNMMTVLENNNLTFFLFIIILCCWFYWFFNCY